MNDELDWIVRAQHGDADAYASLVHAYEQIAFRTAYLLTHDAHTAADVAQEAFVRAYRALPSFKREYPFRPWLLRIVTNVALNHLKAQQRRASLSERYAREMLTNNSPAPENAAVERLQNERLLEAVRRLTPDEQSLIALRYFLELPEAEVAQSLNIPLGTVKSRLHRTLAHLRDIIRREFPELEPVVSHQ